MNFKIIANLTNMKLIKIFSSCIVLFSCLTYAETLDSNAQKYFEYRVNKLENENTELKKKIEEVEKNSRSVEQFKSILEIHEKSMSANNSNLELLSMILTVVSIFVPFAGYFWNKDFMDKTNSELKALSDEYKEKLFEYGEQMKFHTARSNQDRKDRKKEIVIESEQGERKETETKLDQGEREKIGIKSEQGERKGTENSTNESYELMQNQNILSIDNDVYNIKNKAEEVVTNPSKIEENKVLSKLQNLLNHAKISSEKGEIDEALKYYDEITNKKNHEDSNHPQIRFYMANAYYNKGVLLAGRGDFEPAIQQYSKVIDEYKSDFDLEIKKLCVRSYINKLSLLLTLQRYKEAIDGYEEFFVSYMNDDDNDIKLAVVRGHYNYIIALWKNAGPNYLDKIKSSAREINCKYKNNSNPFDIQVFLSKILNLLIFILGENRELKESISEFRGFVIQFSKEVNPNIILEVEKAFNDQIDLFAGLRDFDSIKEMCDIVLNNLQGNQAYSSLLERAKKFKEQLND
ncbi:MAG: tetratricopeptide repeat protein [Neisseria sp.]|nr:tetratricopeptide repeat protein [Neisseria sp.]